MLIFTCKATDIGVGALSVAWRLKPWALFQAFPRPYQSCIKHSLPSDITETWVVPLLAILSYGLQAFLYSVYIAVRINSDGFGGIVRFEHANETVCQFEHLTAQTDDQKLGSPGALFDELTYDCHILKVWWAGGQ